MQAPTQFDKPQPVNFIEINGKKRRMSNSVSVDGTIFSELNELRNRNSLAAKWLYKIKRKRLKEKFGINIK